LSASPPVDMHVNSPAGGGSVPCWSEPINDRRLGGYRHANWVGNCETDRTQLEHDPPVRDHHPLDSTRCACGSARRARRTTSPTASSRQEPDRPATIPSAARPDPSETAVTLGDQSPQTGADVSLARRGSRSRLRTSGAAQLHGSVGSCAARQGLNEGLFSSGPSLVRRDRRCRRVTEVCGAVLGVSLGGGSEGSGG
jgi:hypothetical protein